jgi:glycosyltransferase involved in cell wall biosynthesis
MENIKNSISIITICYNCRHDLEKTIQSVIAQQYPAKEYIVVDGGSTDGTSEILAKYQSDIKVCISEPDNGIYDALNKGIRQATGEWILCLNAGDVFYADNVLKTIFANSIPEEKTFIYSDFELVHDNQTSDIRACDRKKGDVHHQNAIYRRKLHQQYGYYIVTHPYIVSDLLFFLAVPEDQFLKTQQIIARVKDGGIACGLWAAEQAWAAKVIYGMETIPSIFIRDIRQRFGLWRQRMKVRIMSVITNKKS